MSAATESTAIAYRMEEIARELRYAATYNPWRPSPQVALYCRGLAERVDEDAKAVSELAARLTALERERDELREALADIAARALRIGDIERIARAALTSSRETTDGK